MHLYELHAFQCTVPGDLQRAQSSELRAVLLGREGGGSSKP